jgi:hypothetical protein
VLDEMEPKSADNNYQGYKNKWLPHVKFILQYRSHFNKFLLDYLNFGLW